MPHDANGKVLKEGDEVILRGRLAYIGQSEGDQFCNATMIADRRMPGAPNRLETFSSLNSTMLEKVEPGCGIGWALDRMREGKKVRRAGWNGKGMFVVLMPELKLPAHSAQHLSGPRVNERTAKHIGVDTPLDSQPYIAMWTAKSQWQPGWLCSQADLLATDWELA